MYDGDVQPCHILALLTREVGYGTICGRLGHGVLKRYVIAVEQGAKRKEDHQDEEDSS